MNDPPLPAMLVFVATPLAPPPSLHLFLMRLWRPYYRQTYVWLSLLALASYDSQRRAYYGVDQRIAVSI